MPELFRADIAKIDLGKPVMHSQVGEVLVTGDSNANRYGAIVSHGSEEIDLSGCTCEGWFIAPSGETIIIPGAVRGNMAYVDLNAECYQSEGAFTLALKIKQDESIITLRMMDGRIRLAYSYTKDALIDAEISKTVNIIIIGGENAYDVAYVTMEDGVVNSVYKAECTGAMNIACVPGTLLTLRNNADNPYAIAVENVELLDSQNEAMFQCRIGDADGMITLDGKSADASVLTAGALIAIPESSGKAWYRLVDTDYYGYSLLVREECLAETSRYHSSVPSNTSGNKYNNSRLDVNINEFYNALPDATKAIIQSVAIPVRSNASSGVVQEYLTRNAFALSAVEWGVNDQNFEGVPIEYTGSRSIGVAYWTREPVAGMANYARTISNTGTASNLTVISSCGVRPAFCIAKDQVLSTVDGGWEVVV